MQVLYFFFFCLIQSLSLPSLTRLPAGRRGHLQRRRVGAPQRRRGHFAGHGRRPRVRKSRLLAVGGVRHHAPGGAGCVDGARRGPGQRDGAGRARAVLCVRLELGDAPQEPLCPHHALQLPVNKQASDDWRSIIGVRLF